MHPRFIERASFGATIAVLNCCPMRRSIRFSRPGMKRACDQEELQRCFRLQIEAGVDGLIVCGSLGEASTLDLGEKLETLHLARSVSYGRQVLFTVCDGSSRNVQKAAERAAGADALQIRPARSNRRGHVATGLGQPQLAKAEIESQPLRAAGFV